MTSLAHACDLTFNNLLVVHAETVCAHDLQFLKALLHCVGRDDAIKFILDKNTLDRQNDIEKMLVDFFDDDCISTYARIDEVIARAKTYRFKTVI